MAKDDNTMMWVALLGIGGYAYYTYMQDKTPAPVTAPVATTPSFPQLPAPIQALLPQSSLPPLQQLPQPVSNPMPVQSIPVQPAPVQQQAAPINISPIPVPIQVQQQQQPAAQPVAPAIYGINSGQSVAVPGGTVVVVANYGQLVGLNGNLLNPNYQMTTEENAQYLNNYLDLRQWDYSYGPAFQGPPLKGQSIQQAAQWHWTNHGCSERRIFVPLVPPSVIPYSGAQPAKSSSVFGDVLKVVTVVGAGVAEVASAGTLTPIIAPAASLALSAESKISGADDLQPTSVQLEVLFSGAAILSNILPFYNNVDPTIVNLINNKLTSVLNQYS